MYLRSLTLREFAGVSQLTLDRFEDGLNVVVGDNEAGKIWGSFELVSKSGVLCITDCTNVDRAEGKVKED